MMNTAEKTFYKTNVKNMNPDQFEDTKKYFVEDIQKYKEELQKYFNIANKNSYKILDQQENWDQITFFIPGDDDDVDDELRFIPPLYYELSDEKYMSIKMLQSILKDNKFINDYDDEMKFLNLYYIKEGEDKLTLKNVMFKFKNTMNLLYTLLQNKEKYELIGDITD